MLETTHADRRGRKGAWSKHFLTAKSAENPRRPGTRGHQSFQVILDNPGCSTEFYLSNGGRHQDIKFDIAHDYVEAVPME